MSFKSQARTALNRLLAPAGLQITKAFSADRDSFPVSAIMREHAVASCVPGMRKVAAFFGAPDLDVQACVAEFYKVYFESTMRQSTGSSGLNALLTLYIAVKSLRPDFIVESGTFQGFSSWSMRQSSPSAEIHCFDLSFQNLIYRDPAIHYWEHDWAAAPLNFTPTDRSFGYFDDHVDQSLRIEQAAERGVKWLVLDDNVSWHTLFRDGLPPAPTVDMLFDDSLPDGTDLEWVSANSAMTYRCDKARDLRLRKLIKRYEKVENLHDQTGYVSTPMALVELN